MNPVPDLLTIEEAARVLRIGRTKAYAMGQEWRVTNGESGIMVCEVGGQLRVPKVWIEAQLDAPLLHIPGRPQRLAGIVEDERPEPAPRPREHEPAPAVKATPTPTRKRSRRSRRTDDSELILPFG